MGFGVSDVYPVSMMAGRRVFLRLDEDHHGIALVDGAEGQSRSRDLNHVAFAVETLDEVFEARRHLERHGVKIAFEGRRRAGAQIAVEFLDPDGHKLEIYWGLDRIGPGEPLRPPDGWMVRSSLEEAVATHSLGQDTMLRNPGLRGNRP